MTENMETETRGTDGVETEAAETADSEQKGRQERKKPALPGQNRFSRGFLAGMLTAAVLLVAITGGSSLLSKVFGGSFASDSVSVREVNNKLNDINALVEEYYLYDDEIDKDALIEGIYSGYVAALGDLYTEYYDAEETKAMMEDDSGEFSGIGASILRNAQTGKFTITEVYEGSPADKAGIQAGDVLYQVDGHLTDGESSDTVLSWTKGETGTEVVIQVIRDGETMEFTVTRDVIEEHTVEYEMKYGQTGYIYVEKFADVTYEQFKTALEDLESQGMTGLVIDLRGNPGGNFNTVTDMLRLILPEGVIVSVKDKYGNTEEETCDGENEFAKPLAVLVDGRSASASEIFSAAVQDYGIGTIVGQTTYGKGVVQQIIGMGDGTSLKVTIAEYYTPSGNSINGTGVQPDVEVEYVYDENNPKADNQLEAALEAVRAE